MPFQKGHAIGRGKPPVHSQFKKGQSGNPGGRPGPILSFQQRLRSAVETALERSIWDLMDSKSSGSSLETIASELVLEAASGKPQAVKTLLALTDKYAAEDLQHSLTGKAAAAAGTIAGGLPDEQTQDVSLSQGKIQGGFENQAAAEPTIEPQQDVSDNNPPASGNGSGTEGGAALAAAEPAP
ncbi:MAG TPA: DUF5681 domain-containing protein [Rhizomicrobium sp.]